MARSLGRPVPKRRAGVSIEEAARKLLAKASGVRLEHLEIAGALRRILPAVYDQLGRGEIPIHEAERLLKPYRRRCATCKGYFYAKRTDAKLCSDRCRQLNSRKALSQIKSRRSR
jgi:hypothetical protein